MKQARRALLQALVLGTASSRANSARCSRPVVVPLAPVGILARLEATWAGRTAEQRSQAWIDRQMRAVHASLKAMSLGLGDKPWCNGNHFTLADVAVGVALAYLDFRFSHIDWRGDPAAHQRRPARVGRRRRIRPRRRESGARARGRPARLLWIARKDRADEGR